MKKNDTPMDPVEDLLKEHFRHERTNAPKMDDAFFERMVASAAHMNPVKLPVEVPEASLLQKLIGAVTQFEGWRSASVLTASAIFGVMLGYAGPEGFSELPVLSQLSETLVLDLDSAIEDFDTGLFDLVLAEG